MWVSGGVSTIRMRNNGRDIRLQLSLILLTANSLWWEGSKFKNLMIKWIYRYQMFPVEPSIPPFPNTCVGKVKKMKAICTWFWYHVSPFSTWEHWWGGRIPSTWHILWVALWTPLDYYVGLYFGFFGSQNQLMAWSESQLGRLFCSVL